jgi:hypothetical protein
VYIVAPYKWSQPILTRLFVTIATLRRAAYQSVGFLCVAAARGGFGILWERVILLSVPNAGP